MEDTQEERQKYIEIRDKLMSFRTNDERRRLLYKWVRGRTITYEQFDQLIYYIT